MQTHVFLRSPAIQTRSAALGAAVLDRLNTLDPGEIYAVPTVRFLPDTTPRNSQWRRPRAYYGQSLHGTDWPDRWVAEWGQG